MKSLKSAWNHILEYGAAHSTEILIGLGIAGSISATIMAVKATPKAYKKYEEIRERHINKETNKIEDKKAYTKEIAKNVVHSYIPALCVEGLSIFCIVKGTSISLNKSTAYATLYSISRDQLRDYQAKTLETVGERKEHEIRDAIAKDNTISIDRIVPQLPVGRTTAKKIVNALQEEGYMHRKDGKNGGEWVIDKR